MLYCIKLKVLLLHMLNVEERPIGWTWVLSKLSKKLKVHKNEFLSGTPGHTSQPVCMFHAVHPSPQSIELK